MRQRLIDTADRIPSLAGTSVSGGRLNAARLLSGDTSQPATPPATPIVTPPVVRPTPLPGLGRDVLAPTIVLELAPVRFKAGKKAKLRYDLSEAAAVSVSSERRADGRRKGRKCVATTRKNKKAKRCTRWLADKGTLTRLIPAGKGTLTFKGRLGGRTLAKGTHRLRIRAADAAGNVRDAAPVTFVILAR